MDRTHGALAIISSTLMVVTTIAPAMGAIDETHGLDLQAELTEFGELVPGGAAAVTTRNGITTTAATGIVDVGGAPTAFDTPFLIGPLGWPLNVVIVMQLVDEGSVRLDESVLAYSPDAPVSPEATVEQLLNMRAGVPDPQTGDAIVVLTSNIDLIAPELVREIASSWAVDETDGADSAVVGDQDGG